MPGFILLILLIAFALSHFPFASLAFGIVERGCGPITSVEEAQVSIPDEEEFKSIEIKHACAMLMTHASYRGTYFDYTVENFGSRLLMNTALCKLAFVDIVSKCNRESNEDRGGWAVQEGTNYSMSFADTPLWDLYVEKAVPRLHKLQARLLSHTLDSPSADIDEEHWKFESHEEDAMYPDIQDVMAKVIGAAATRTHENGNADEMERIVNITVTSTEPGNDAYYSNSFVPQAGLIISHLNFDRTFYLTGDDAAKPKTLKWSDIVFDLWNALCAKYGADPEQLRYLLRSSIMNLKTRTIMRMAVGTHETMEEIRWFSIDDEDPGAFLALSMTPNAIGGFWMAWDRPLSLGVYPARIGVFLHRSQLEVEYYLVVEFRPCRGVPFLGSRWGRA